MFREFRVWRYLWRCMRNFCSESYVGFAGLYFVLLFFSALFELEFLLASVRLIILELAEVVLSEEKRSVVLIEGQGYKFAWLGLV